MRSERILPSSASSRPRPTVAGFGMPGIFQSFALDVGFLEVNSAGDLTPETGIAGVHECLETLLTSSC
jgi:hypothetical protein